MKTKARHKKKAGAWRVLLVTVLIITGLMLGGILITAPGRAEIKNLSFSDIDFGRLQDGKFTGYYKGVKDSLRNTGVEVTISSGRIVKINAVGGALAGKKQTDEMNNGKSLEDLFRSVMEQETLQVDVISGATLTSKAYLKAVEDALIKAQAAQ